ncbi:ABC transporter ATP-binding protein [Aliibacillus thermotolerans]|uniref:ABC transporter ATP-binding protein n=1 Tax=Aliibacillus thermotolerans TaxID=1834418 RepID=A0ABW0U6A2_9BACI|nr:ABC transporter ATP-binding protein [Aliibacillus thermotolerans]MDA3129335.1 ATP-binding cassette domain-containing protein [Aliibacillus thermotolerans]
MLFTLENVTYRHILHIPTLHIEKNKMTCLIGESGSGKSTLLKLFNKMLSPTSGTILYNGEPLTDIDAVQLRRNVSMLSQTPVMFGETITEDIEICFSFHEKEPPSIPSIEEMCRQFYLHKSGDTKTDTLSGGEKQRLALARMMLLQPNVFLLDEATSALDEKLEKQVMTTLVEQVKKLHASLIYVTHSLEIAHHFSDTVIDVTPYSLAKER